MPRMIVVAGPPGGGKSTAFPATMFGVDGFNADDRAALKNQGSYRSIPPSIRAQVNRELEEFISDHVRAKQNFAFETTLRTDITFKQAPATAAPLLMGQQHEIWSRGPVANSSRFRCYWATLQSKRWKGISARQDLVRAPNDAIKIRASK